MTDPALLNAHRQGSGPPLILVHGLGGSWRSWTPVLDRLAAERSLIAVDLAGHGASPPLSGPPSFAGLADSLAGFIRANGLAGADIAGFSLGGRAVLEMARRGLTSATVALGPGGFWEGWERRFLRVSLLASLTLIRRLGPALPALTRNPVSRAALLAQISARPGRVPPEIALAELRSFLATPGFAALTRDLAESPGQEGAATTPGPVSILWGRKDRLLLPRQAKRAAERFRAAQLRWLDDCGHYLIWDAPAETAALILEATARPAAG